jgi:2Fe-2S ferredoxin
MLDGAFDVKENSRLACQIIFNKNLDGLKIKLAPGSV